MFNVRKYTSSSRNKSYADQKKRNGMLKIGAIVLGTTICVSCFYQFVIVDYYEKKTRENTIMELTNDNSGFVQAYLLVGVDKLERGGSITDNSVLEQVTVRKSLVPENYVKDLGFLKNMVARIDLSKNTVITEDMFVDKKEQITDSIKNQDFNWIRIHAFIEKGNYVDIHYKELDGNDTIVAAKKKVINLSGNIFSTNISEEERMYINNATVRAAVTGGELYTTIYPDPENQKQAEVTYVLDNNIQKEIEKDPSVINKSAKTLVKNSASGSKVDTSTNTQEKPNFAGGNK